MSGYNQEEVYKDLLRFNIKYHQLLNNQKFINSNIYYEDIILALSIYVVKISSLLNDKLIYKDKVNNFFYDDLIILKSPLNSKLKYNYLITKALIVFNKTNKFSNTSFKEGHLFWKNKEYTPISDLRIFNHNKTFKNNYNLLHLKKICAPIIEIFKNYFDLSNYPLMFKELKNIIYNIINLSLTYEKIILKNKLFKSNHEYLVCPGGRLHTRILKRIYFENKILISGVDHGMGGAGLTNPLISNAESFLVQKYYTRCREYEFCNYKNNQDNFDKEKFVFEEKFIPNIFKKKFTLKLPNKNQPKKILIILPFLSDSIEQSFALMVPESVSNIIKIVKKISNIFPNDEILIKTHPESNTENVLNPELNNYKFVDGYVEDIFDSFDIFVSFPQTSAFLTTLISKKIIIVIDSTIPSFNKKLTNILSNRVLLTNRKKLLLTNSSKMNSEIISNVKRFNFKNLIKLCDYFDFSYVQ